MDQYINIDQDDIDDLTIRASFLDIYNSNTGSRLSKIIVVDAVQLCWQILSFLLIFLGNMMEELVLLGKVPQF